MSAPSAPAKMVPVAPPTSQPFWHGTPASYLRMQPFTSRRTPLLNPPPVSPPLGTPRSPPEGPTGGLGRR